MIEKMSRFSNIIGVPTTDLEDARRRRLLNVMLLALAAGTLLTLVVIFVAAPVGLAGRRKEVQGLYIAIVLTLLGTAAVYALNRYVSGKLASVIFLLLWIVVVIFSDEPRQIINGRGLLVFAIPILAASVLLPPWASFGMAGLSSLAIIIISLTVEQIMPNVPAILGFFVLALVSYLSAQSLERALQNLRFANRALQESEERFRLLSEAAFEAIAIHDEGVLLGANDQVFEMYGYEPDELLGKQVLPLTIAPECVEFLRQQISSGATEPYEVIGLRKDGTRFPMEIHGRPMEYEGRTVRVGASRDITERKRAEEELRRSERRYRMLFERSNDAIFVVNVNTGRYLDANAAAERLTGRSVSELGRLTTHDVTPEGAADRLRQVSTTRDSIELGEVVYLRPDETTRTALLSAVHIDEKTVFGIVHDITGHKQAEETLRESEERYRSLFNDVPVGLYRTTPDGQFLDANPAFIEMLGYPDRESLLAADAVDLQVNAGDRQRWQTLLEREGTLRGFEAQLCRHDGAVIWIQDTSRSVRDADGRVLRYEGSMEDITERKQMEVQLRQQERLAAVGQLAGGIAHDFNNFLATIILYSQMTLGKHNLPPDVAQAIEIILEESRRAVKLVQQILDFSRNSMMETRPVDLVSFTERVFAILRQTIPENIRLALAAQGAGPEEYAAPLTVKADPTRIQQALINLALNARDAMPEGGELHVGLSRVTLKPGESPPMAELRIPPGEWVCLTISDTGTGMTEEVQAHLFEPFFTTKEPGKGTGLGLAQVYGIVKQHEGHIGVETAAGAGTTFHIYLPVYEEEVEEVEAKEPSDLPQGRGETILVVEDEARLRKAVGEILESLGYQVLIAANGQEALEVYRSVEEVDLVLADLVMPEMGGKLLIQELKRENPDLKALVITGYVMDVDLQDLKKTGFLGVVNKPFDTGRLAKVVRGALDSDETAQR